MSTALPDNRLQTRAAQRLPADPSTERPAVLSVRGLTIQFGSKTAPVQAVRGIDLDLLEGETLGLVGESGSGKSATLMSILGLIPASIGRRTDGRIRLGDHDLTSMSPKDLNALRGLEIGVVFQNPMSALNPLLSIGRQMADAITAHNTSATKNQIRQRSIELLEIVGIPNPEARLHQFPHELSGGMLQRVTIAMAICHNPRVLFADEPTTALDVTVQAQILQLLAELRSQHRMAMIIVTHDLGVIAETADRVAVMYAGEIVETGPASEVFDNPRHPYTVGLLRSRVTGGRNSTSLWSIPGQPPNLHHVGEGCAFQPRCQHSAGRTECLTTRPVLHQSLRSANLTACHFANTVISELDPPEATP